MTNHPPSVLWHCWLGHQTCKNRRPYNLYCVGADVKPCSINHSHSGPCSADQRRSAPLALLCLGVRWADIWTTKPFQ